MTCVPSKSEGRLSFPLRTAQPQGVKGSEPSCLRHFGSPRTRNQMKQCQSLPQPNTRRPHLCLSLSLSPHPSCAQELSTEEADTFLTTLDPSCWPAGRSIYFILSAFFRKDEIFFKTNTGIVRLLLRTNICLMLQCL